MNKGRTSTAGYEKSKLHTYLSLIKYFRNNREFALHDYHDVFSEANRVLEKYVAKEVQDTWILEIGCGQRFSATLLFHLLGAHVTGIDADFVEPNFSVRGLLRMLKANGIERFVKTSFRHILFDPAYYNTLQKEFGRPLKMDGIDVRAMDACSLEFPDSHFDYVFSNAVFEHISDVDKACFEIARVLKPGGISNVVVHLFPSISGGHNLEWHNPDEKPSKTVPPWDHLRQDLFPTHVYLNRLRERDYLSVFDKHFSIIDVESKYEGEKLLTKEILTELSDFPRDELLKRTIRVVMKNR
jgi:SAM-dependent methyltransferase